MCIRKTSEFYAPLFRYAADGEVRLIRRLDKALQMGGDCDRAEQGADGG